MWGLSVIQPLCGLLFKTPVEIFHECQIQKNNILANYFPLFVIFFFFVALSLGKPLKTASSSENKNSPNILKSNTSAGKGQGPSGPVTAPHREQPHHWPLLGYCICPCLGRGLRSPVAEWDVTYSSKDLRLGSFEEPRLTQDTNVRIVTSGVTT